MRRGILRVHPRWLARSATVIFISSSFKIWKYAQWRDDTGLYPYLFSTGMDEFETIISMKWILPFKNLVNHSQRRLRLYQNKNNSNTVLTFPFTMKLVVPELVFASSLCWSGVRRFYNSIIITYHGYYPTPTVIPCLLTLLSFSTDPRELPLSSFVLSVGLTGQPESRECSFVSCWMDDPLNYRTIGLQYLFFVHWFNLWLDGASTLLSAWPPQTVILCHVKTSRNLKLHMDDIMLESGTIISFSVLCRWSLISLSRNVLLTSSS